MKPNQPYSPDSPEADALLDAATAGLRDMKIPDGPSPKLIEMTREALGGSGFVGSALRTAVLDEQQRVRNADPTEIRSSTSASQRPSVLPRDSLDRGRSYLLRPAFLRIAAVIAILSAVTGVYFAARHRASSFVVKTELRKPQPSPISPPVQPTPSPSPIVTPAPPTLANNSKSAEPASAQLADGVIAGQVFFAGPIPRPTPLPGVNLMPECEKLHGGPIYDESLVVNPNGGLANVVVSVSSGLSGWLREEFPPPVEQPVLDQKGCVFEPHVIALMVGEPLLIKNSDPMLHNVRVMAVNNPPANLGQVSSAEMATGPFESPEVFRVKCDVHPWMQAWVRVVDNPFFAVTGRDGRFTLHGLPPGTYTLKAWHERLGVREMQVTVGPGQGTLANFKFVPLGD